MDNKLYTTVTLSDFNNTEYINELKKLDIGIELALLTPVSSKPNQENYPTELAQLKEEINNFKKVFTTFEIECKNVRIHQPGGNFYNWFKKTTNEIDGYDALKDFFAHCTSLGFAQYIIHAPYGNPDADEKTDLFELKTKLKNLVPGKNVEVEEIVTSNKNVSFRLYAGDMLEKLIEGIDTTILLDTHECGGIAQTIERLKNLKNKGLQVKSIHLHKNKHQCLEKEEVQKIIGANFSGNLINEGFITSNGNFDEFVKTKSSKHILAREEKIKILKSYLNKNR